MINLLQQALQDQVSESALSEWIKTAQDEKLDE
jgi:hypothetical protein